jgi:hypothetical protein
VPYFHADGCQFRQNRGITEINIGANVPAGDKIKKVPFAFARECDNLTKVTGLSEVTEIANSAFAYLRNLQSIDTTNALTVLDKEAFRESSIKCIDLSNVTTLGDGAFRICRSLLSLSTSDPT